jgi:hypothetical protein
VSSKRILVMTIAVVYALVLVAYAMLQEDTFLYNMLNDEDCYSVQHVQFEDGSCLIERGV